MYNEFCDFGIVLIVIRLHVLFLFWILLLLLQCIVRLRDAFFKCWIINSMRLAKRFFFLRIGQISNFEIIFYNLIRNVFGKQLN